MQIKQTPTKQKNQSAIVKKCHTASNHRTGNETMLTLHIQSINIANETTFDKKCLCRRQRRQQTDNNDEEYFRQPKICRSP